jgi:hypothetical protein
MSDKQTITITDIYTFRELRKMGYFDAKPKEKPIQKTRSNRKVRPPKRYIDEQFKKGSGCCPMPNKEPTDMKFDGSKR